MAGQNFTDTDFFVSPFTRTATTRGSFERITTILEQQRFEPGVNRLDRPDLAAVGRQCELRGGGSAEIHDHGPGWAQISGNGL